MIVILTNTEPTLLLNPNPNRRRLMLQMQAQVVDANNTGRIHIGKGFQPVATVGHASQGIVLTQGAYEAENKEFPEDERPFKGAIWATSSQNTQSIRIDEEVE